ncbi:hypothetical protein V1478_004510 [Vespula squamosa]|uniref:Protein kinase domain-containing protein n=1 Tax=Vespula squamosa TaxID=30214 RepID=A0ABD2BGD8_VESSQ
MDLKPENLLFREEADRSDERDETGVHGLDFTLPEGHRANKRHPVAVKLEGSRDRYSGMTLKGIKSNIVYVTSPVCTFKKGALDSLKCKH